MGGLCNLYALDSDVSHLLEASTITQAALQALTSAQQILTEPCTGSCVQSADVPTFKGVFMRNAMYLIAAVQSYLDTTPSPAPYAAQFEQLLQQLTTFIELNAASICHHNCVQSQSTQRTFLGFAWAGPFDSCDAARQASALEALIAYEFVQTLRSP